MLVRGGELDLGPLFPAMALDGVVQRGALCVDLSAGPGRVAAYLGGKECTVLAYFSALSDQFIGGRGQMNKHNGWLVDSGGHDPRRNVLDGKGGGGVEGGGVRSWGGCTSLQGKCRDDGRGL
jgi:hypothetical protein